MLRGGNSFNTESVEDIYFLDLDDTLIDTKSFFNKLMRLVAEYDVKIATEVAEQVELHRKKFGTSAMYNPCDTLRQNPEIWQVIEGGVDSEQFVYPDVFDFVEKITTDTNSQAIILTYGYTDYQKLKVQDTFLAKMPMIVTENKLKIHDIKDMQDEDGKYVVHLADKAIVGHNAILVDDKEVSFSGGDSLVNFKGYLIQRKKDKHIDQGLPENIELVKSLSDI